MLRKKVLVVFLSSLLFCLVSLLWNDSKQQHPMLTRMIILSDSKTSSGKTANYVDDDMKIVEVDTSKKEEVVEDRTIEDTNTNNTTTILNVAPKALVKKPPIVYDGMTLEELANKLERSFKNELSGKGYLYASYSLEKGVDPYLAAAISLEETGCNWNCSNLVKKCNNVGGMVGSGCGGFSAFATLDTGIKAFIDNIYRNYVAYGLTTADTMNPKYAENPLWSRNVNNYITRIKNN